MSNSDLHSIQMIVWCSLCYKERENCIYTDSCFSFSFIIFQFPYPNTHTHTQTSNIIIIIKWNKTTTTKKIAKDLVHMATTPNNSNSNHHLFHNNICSRKRNSPKSLYIYTHTHTYWVHSIFNSISTIRPTTTTTRKKRARTRALCIFSLFSFLFMF